MKGIDNPIVDEATLRKDLYLAISLLLADKNVDKVPDVVTWTKDFHENEVQKLMLWAAVAMRTRLDLLRGKDETRINERRCGEYWPDFPKSQKISLTFRQACNSIIHAKEILPYKVPSKQPKMAVRQVYSGRITVRSAYRGKTTRAQIDVIKFVQIANILINHSQETSNANR